MKTILLTCGETSGEHHASRVVYELRSRDPSARVVALGGRELEAAGAEILFPMAEYAFMGFSEVVTHLPKVFALERKIKKLLRSGRIDLFMPVDYPGLNLRLARYAKAAGVPVLYFVSPQVWAWGGWRVKRMKEIVDLMTVILPFEEEIYRRAGIPVVFVGHSALDEIEAPALPKEAPQEKQPFNILLFPGSRQQEVARMLPPLIEASLILKRRFPQARFRLGLAPLIEEETLDIPLDVRAFIEITRRGVDELTDAALVLAASGTVTLLTAISGTPMVVFYKTTMFTYLLGRLLVKIPWIAMPNVLAGERLVPELVQGDATPARIADEAAALLGSGNRYRELSSNLIGLRERLRGSGGAVRVADVAVRMANGEEIGDIIGSSIGEGS